MACGAIQQHAGCSLLDLLGNEGRELYRPAGEAVICCASCLRLWVAQMDALGARHAHDPNAGNSIREGGQARQQQQQQQPARADAGMQADMDMARRLQAQLDAQQARGNQRCVCASLIRPSLDAGSA